MKFLNKSTYYLPYEEPSSPIVEDLPPAIYNLDFAMPHGFYFTQTEDFKIPSVLYGSVESLSERILNTAADRQSTTGVLLCGLKGSGKTLQAKKIALDGLARGWPTFILNNAYRGSSFLELMQAYTKPAIIMIDEFDKLYGGNRASDHNVADEAEDAQKGIISLLEGVFSAQKLVIMTANDQYRVSEFLKNRPGRIYYSLEYKGLEKEFITGYCRDNLSNQEFTKGLMRLTYLFEDFNFDMLKAIVEECNRYNEEPKKVIELLNIKVSAMESYAQYEPTLYLNDTKVDLPDKLTINGNFRFSNHFHVELKETPQSMKGLEGFRVFFYDKDLSAVTDDGDFIYTNDKGYTVKLSRMSYAEKSRFDVALAD